MNTPSESDSYEFLDTASDRALWNWLNHLWLAGVRSNQLRIDLEGYTIYARCQTPQVVQFVSDSRSGLGKYFDLEVFWEEKRISPRSYPTMGGGSDHFRKPHTMLTVQQMRSSFAVANEKMLERIDAIMFLHKIDADKGYPILAAIPDRFGERRLARSSVEKSIGLAVSELPPTIATPRLQAIEQAILTGEKQTYAYEHFWDLVKLPFRFETEVEKVSEDEVLVIVRDHPTYAAPQKWFWEEWQG